MIIDYDLKGLAGLRLVDPPAALARFTSRQMDPLSPTAPAREPEIMLVPLGDRTESSRYTLGNAGDWPANAPRYGWAVQSTARRSCVMVMPYDNGRLYWVWSGSAWYQTKVSSFGHVAWIDDISCNGACVHIRDRNWGYAGQDGERWVWIGHGEPVKFICA